MLTVIGSESIILSLMTSSLPIGGTLFLESSTLSVSIEDAPVLSSVLSELVTLPFSLPFPKAMLDVMGSDSTFLSLTIPSMLIPSMIDLENMVAPSVYSTYGPLHTSLVASSPIVVEPSIMSSPMVTTVDSILNKYIKAFTTTIRHQAGFFKLLNIVGVAANTAWKWAGFRLAVLQTTGN
ncbi:hypothetical protein ACFE04_022017 [Oxalis oulophora]